MNMNMNIEGRIPVFLAAVLFAAGILVNFADRNAGTSIVLGLVAVPSLLFLNYLSEKKLNVLGYILLFMPGIVVYYGYQQGLDHAIEEEERNFIMY